MKIFLPAIVLLLVGVFGSIAIDVADRSFLRDQLKCNRADIERQFFHFNGRDTRVYIVNGQKWLVNGLFYREASRSEFGY